MFLCGQRIDVKHRWLEGGQTDEHSGRLSPQAGEICAINPGVESTAAHKSAHKKFSMGIISEQEYLAIVQSDSRFQVESSALELEYRNMIPNNEAPESVQSTEDLMYYYQARIHAQHKKYKEALEHQAKLPTHSEPPTSTSVAQHAPELVTIPSEPAIETHIQETVRSNKKKVKQRRNMLSNQVRALALQRVWRTVLVGAI